MNVTPSHLNGSDPATDAYYQTLHGKLQNFRKLQLQKLCDVNKIPYDAMTTSGAQMRNMLVEKENVEIPEPHEYQAFIDRKYNKPIKPVEVKETKVETAVGSVVFTRKVEADLPEGVIDPKWPNYVNKEGKVCYIGMDLTEEEFFEALPDHYSAIRSLAKVMGIKSQASTKKEELLDGMWLAQKELQEGK